MRTSKEGKSVYLDIGIWYDEEQDSIHLVAKDVDGFHTTVNRDPQNMRGHPNLFGKLAKCLKLAGAPAPEVEASDA
jgi:hypothetical protein